MAVNQAQVDHIISTASADDPEVKLLKLQDEVELIKTSIKRLLIDIRERMNDLENPIIVSPGKTGNDQEAYSQMARTLKDTSTAVESAAGALKSSSEVQRDEGKNETPAAAVTLVCTRICSCPFITAVIAGAATLPDRYRPPFRTPGTAVHGVSRRRDCRACDRERQGPAPEGVPSL